MKAPPAAASNDGSGQNTVFRSSSALVRIDAQVLRSTDGKLESRPLAPAGASSVVEVYELRLSARSAVWRKPTFSFSTRGNPSRSLLSAATVRRYR